MRFARPATIAIGILLAMRLVGCGSSVSSDTYDQTCKQASDCLVVGVGDPCSTPCEQFPAVDAINAKAQAKYSYDAVSAQYACTHCGALPQQCKASADVTRTKTAYCVASRCAVCDSTDVCKCAPHDPACTRISMDGGAGDAGGDAEGDAAGDATTSPADSGESEAAVDAGGEAAADAGADGARDAGKDGSGDASAD